MVEDRPGSTGSDRTFSWWDIQDANAKLPVKETSQSELRKLFYPRKHSESSSSSSTTDTAAKAAKGAFKMMGKAMSAVAGADDHTATDNGPHVAVLAFKLVDLVKIHDDFAKKHGNAPTSSAPRRVPAAAPRAVQPQRQQQQQQYQQPTAPTPQRRPSPQPPMPQQQQHQQQRTTSRGPSPVPPVQQQQQRPRPTPQQQPQQRPQEASLMDFGDTPTQRKAAFNHSNSLPAGFGGGGAPAPPSNETRAEKLKREYTNKNQTANRVWDPIDERWVEVDKTPPGADGTAAALRTNINSAPPGDNAPPKKKEVGISLDPANAVGKTASVQAAIHERVNAMQEAQAKALQDVRERDEKKKKDEEEEDAARRALEPKIKIWSEEHGKKKQLRALLASLHTILWPGATWKVISIGDILDDGKVKRFYHKATLVVHPDKTHHLPPDQRFLAKRIFDALSQAKTEFDNGPK
jgi:hypothetical protein